MVLRGETYCCFGVSRPVLAWFEYTLALLVNLLEFAPNRLLVFKCLRTPSKREIPPMVPGRVIPHVLLQQLFYSLELSRVPQAEALYQPLPVTPNVIVLHIQLEHLHQKILFAFRAVELVYDGVAVVPDLVVLLVLEGDPVEPLDFFAEVLVGAEEDACAVEPRYWSISGLECTAGMIKESHQTV